MSDDRTPRLTRRGFLAGTIAAALVACSDDGSGSRPNTTRPAEASADASPAITSDPFTLGVASGDPLADSVILWTRLLPADPLADTDIEVTWEIARDAEFADVVADQFLAVLQQAARPVS